MKNVDFNQLTCFTRKTPVRLTGVLSNCKILNYQTSKYELLRIAHKWNRKRKETWILVRHRKRMKKKPNPKPHKQKTHMLLSIRKQSYNPKYFTTPTLLEWKPCSKWPSRKELRSCYFYHCAFKTWAILFRIWLYKLWTFISISNNININNYVISLT